MLDGKVAVYFKVVRYTPNRIHGQNAEFINITYSLVTMDFKRLNYFEYFVLWSRFNLISSLNSLTIKRGVVALDSSEIEIT